MWAAVLLASCSTDFHVMTVARAAGESFTVGRFFFGRPSSTARWVAVASLDFPCASSSSLAACHFLSAAGYLTLPDITRLLTCFQPAATT